MYSTVLFDGTDTGIVWVLWAVLAIFFVMTILGWLVASKGWLQEDQEEYEEHPEHDQAAHV